MQEDFVRFESSMAESYLLAEQLIGSINVRIPTATEFVLWYELAWLLVEFTRCDHPSNDQQIKWQIAPYQASMGFPFAGARSCAATTT